MILRELGDYLQQQQKVTRRQLARHFHTTEEAIDAMAGVWMRKGRLIRRQTSLCQGSCCGKSQEVLFEWCREHCIAIKVNG